MTAEELNFLNWGSGLGKFVACGSLLEVGVRTEDLEGFPNKHYLLHDLLFFPDTYLPVLPT